MISADPIVAGPAALAEAKAYLRASSGGEDAVIERLIPTALELCERFTGQVLVAREFRETLPASAAWIRLGRRPVQAITAIEAVDGSGSVMLPSAAYSVDVDAGGSGWIRAAGSVEHRVLRARYTAGLSPDWEGLPEPLAQGVLRLTGHLFAQRGGQGEGEPPAAVTALWRPYRQLRVA